MAADLRVMQRNVGKLRLAGKTFVLELVSCWYAGSSIAGCPYVIGPIGEGRSVILMPEPR
jgi:hypothetical protein